METNPVLVIGVQRSGTTILARLLAKHKSIYLTVNGKLLYYLITWIYRDSNSYPGDHLRLDEIAYSLTRKPILGIDKTDTEKMVEMLLKDLPSKRFTGKMAGEIVIEIWREVYSRLAGYKTVVGDKYNEYLLQLPEIRKLFPHARYIFLYRNPFDVAESMIRAFRGRPWAPDNQAAALIKWTNWNMQWLQARETIPEEKRFELSYEIMVNKPEQTFDSLCQFLQIPFTPEFSELVKKEIKTDSIGKGSSLRLDEEVLASFATELQKVTDTFSYSLKSVEGRMGTDER